MLTMRSRYATNATAYLARSLVVILLQPPCFVLKQAHLLLATPFIIYGAELAEAFYAIAAGCPDTSAIVNNQQIKDTRHGYHYAMPPITS